jgi:3-deoxy-manno-octulosonate cytidylyltransferase (CMP-KDO synthetase)
MADPRAVADIPARLASSRFPGKVLADKTGRPLIQHVYEAARAATKPDLIIIAADDDRVRRAAESFGATCVMTSPAHPNGTSRLAEVAATLSFPDSTIVVNVQGDEPEMEGGVIDAAIAALETSPALVATVASPWNPADDPANPNIVKVVRRADGRALYFSRALIPYPREPDNAAALAPLRHVGIYAYRAGFLKVYASLAPSPLEATEMLEQLRILDHGYDIAVALHPCQSAGIDTPEQYESFVLRWNARRR